MSSLVSSPSVDGSASSHLITSYLRRRPWNKFRVTYWLWLLQTFKSNKIPISMHSASVKESEIFFQKEILISFTYWQIKRCT